MQGEATARSTPRGADASYAGGARKDRRRRWLVSLVAVAVTVLLGEAGFRLFWNPRYWIRCDRWQVGSGQTRAGRKWWPETTYRIESREFRARFHTNALGYRKRPTPPRTARPYRTAFVGDSFTEAMQVEYDRTFVARLERELGTEFDGREVVCENFGVAATGPFDYWHRIIHDVLRPHPPDALVLCLFPGNDFCDPIPDDGFEPDGRPRREYFREAGGLRHLTTWLNLKSKLGHYLLMSAQVAAFRWSPPPVQGPWIWWTDPALTARSGDAPAVRRTRALLRAIADECRGRGTRLVFLVVGPAPFYQARDGGSPLARIVADWGLDVPVIDVAVAAAAVPDPKRLVFASDGHLNETGHAFVAAEALAPLRAALAPAATVSLGAPDGPARR